MRGAFFESHGFEPFFVFHRDTEWSVTPWTLPHKNLFFAAILPNRNVFAAMEDVR